MKNIYLLLLFCSAALHVHAQKSSNKEGTVTIMAGYDIGAYGLEHYMWQDGNELFGRTGNALTSNAVVSIQMGVLEMLSIGVSGSFGNYYEDPLYVGKSGSIYYSAAGDVRFYLANYPYFNWYVGGLLGLSTLSLSNDDDKGRAVEILYRGPYMGITNGLHWYFGSSIGVNFALVFSNMQFRLDNYTIDGDIQSTPGLSSSVTGMGVHVRFGVSYKLY
jgi:hypothetical protein